MRNRSLLSILIVPALTLGGCSMKRDLDEMHDATVHMAGTTDKMATTTERMAGTTERMAETTEGMAENTEDMARTTESMAETTEGMARTTEAMSERTETMAANTERMAGTTERMADTTEGMARTTERMAETTEGLARTTTEMAERTEHMAATTDSLLATTTATYTDLRQGNSLAARADALKRMDEARSVEAKCFEAGAYVAAFEFQLRKEGTDSEEEVRSMYHQAVEQFFRDIKRFTDRKMSVDPTLKSNQMRNLYALAAAMHRVNANEEQAALKAGREPVRLITLITDTLAKKDAIEAGSPPWAEVPAFEREILSHEADAVYMLRLRANFIPLIALAGITKLEHTSFIEKAMRMNFGYDAAISKLKYAQIREYALYMKATNDLRDQLRRMGYKLKTDPKVKKLFRNMNIRKRDLPRTSAQPANDEQRAANERAAALGELLDEIERYRR